MSDAVLRHTMRRFLDEGGDTLAITWQGGEPTLMGLPFFQRVAWRKNPDIVFPPRVEQEPSTIAGAFARGDGGTVGDDVLQGWHGSGLSAGPAAAEVATTATRPP